jgi:hypothetical protein
MRDNILELLSSLIDVSNVEDNNYDVAFLKDITDKISNDKDYFNTFLTDIDEDLLRDIVDLLDVNERKKVLASSLYLKSLMVINKEQGVEIPLSESQREILYDLYNLMKKAVSSYEQRQEVASKEKELKTRYQNLLQKISLNSVLTVDDYNLIEKVIYKLVMGNQGKVLNTVMSALNSYNIGLLAGCEAATYTKDEKKDKYVLVRESENKTLVVSKKEELGLKEEKDISMDVDTKTGIAEKTRDLSKEEKYLDIDIDIFNPQSFDYQKESKSKTKEKETINNYNYQTFLLEAGISYDDLSDYAKNLLASCDGTTIKETYDFVKKTFNSMLKPQNVNGLIGLVCNSDEKTIKDLFGYLKDNNFTDEEVCDLINRCTVIFFKGNSENFKNNVGLALKYGDVKSLIKNNITFFYNSYEYNKNKVNLLEERNVNINKIMMVKPQILAMRIDVLLNNIEVLTNYGYDLVNGDYDSFSIVGANNLNVMIDLFIEDGFSEYIFMGDSMKNTRSLIIKRLYYAYKNNLNIWRENVLDNRINEVYEEFINKKRRSLNEDEISYLISDYEILDFLENGKRGTLFSDVNLAQVRRKYEFKFNNVILSRLKTYSVFKALVSSDVPLREAMFYALTYNSNLSDADYLMVKKEILGK